MLDHFHHGLTHILIILAAVYDADSAFPGSRCQPHPRPELRAYGFQVRFLFRRFHGKCFFFVFFGCGCVFCVTRCLLTVVLAMYYVWYCLVRGVAWRGAARLRWVMPRKSISSKCPRKTRGPWHHSCRLISYWCWRCWWCFSCCCRRWCCWCYWTRIWPPATPAIIKKR